MAVQFSLHQGGNNQMVAFVLFYIKFEYFIARDNLVATRLFIIIFA